VTRPWNFAEATVKPMAGGVAMMLLGLGSTTVKSRAPASTSRWVMRRNPSGAGNCSSWWISSCSSGHCGSGIGSLAGAEPRMSRFTV
jgi:hypothetical protein